MWVVIILFLDWRKNGRKVSNPTTPNVMNITGLGFVCVVLFAEDYGTIENLYVATQEKAQLMYDFLKIILFSPAISVGRSESVLVFSGAEYDISTLHARLAKEGIEVGKGYGTAKAHQIRIGNFPVSKKEDVQYLLETIEENSLDAEYQEISNQIQDDKRGKERLPDSIRHPKKKNERIRDCG